MVSQLLGHSSRKTAERLYVALLWQMPLALFLDEAASEIWSAQGSDIAGCCLFASTADLVLGRRGGQGRAYSSTLVASTDAWTYLLPPSSSGRRLLTDSRTND